MVEGWVRTSEGWQMTKYGWGLPTPKDTVHVDKKKKKNHKAHSKKQVLEYRNSDLQSFIDNFCWLCGHEYGLTRQHVIPRCLHPKRNIIIPLCNKCHKLLDVNVQLIKLMYEQRKQIEKST